MFLQIYADVIGQPMLVAGSSQAPALGAAISAAVTAGEHRVVDGRAEGDDVGRRTGSSLPIRAAHAVYNELYAIYRELHDEFGGVTQRRISGSVMKRLLAIRASVTCMNSPRARLPRQSRARLNGPRHRHVRQPVDRRSRRRRLCDQAERRAVRTI